MPEAPLDNATLLARSLERARALEATDAVIHQSSPLLDVLDELQGLQHAVEVFATVCDRYAARPALGTRAFEFVQERAAGRFHAHYLPGFETMSYAELWRRTVAVASGWRADELVQQGALVGICGFGSPEFVLADLACLYLGAVSVPLQTTLAPGVLARIVQDAEISCLVASRDQLALVASVVPQCPSVRSLGVIDWRAEETRDVELLERVRRALAGQACRLWTLAELETLGRHGTPAPMVVPRDGDDPLVTLLYTSGSTGVPKGAMFTDSLWLQTWLRAARTGMMPALPQLTVSYLPMNHLMGRGGLISTLTRGGLTHFTLAPDMSTLFEDIRLVRPTMLSLVPRVAEMIHQHFEIELVRRGGQAGEAALAEHLMDEMRETFLGDRLLWANIGSAPTPPQVLRFLKRCFGIPVLEGYGSTEAGVITYENRIVKDAVLDYKLIDAPEAGFFVSNRPYPRGQLLVKARWSVPGYYRSPEASRALYDDEGYLRTGDVVEDRGDGELVWIGRAKDVIKLAQGEFVTLWRLESVLTSGGPLIRQAYLHGDSDRAYLVGVVVPDREAVSARLAGEGRAENEGAVKRLLREEIDRLAAQSELRPFEVPRDFLVEWTPFTKENGLLTESNKIARPRLKERYGERLEQLYAEIDHHQLCEIAALREEANAPIALKVRTAAQAILGLTDLDMERRFTDLGGDSLAAVQLATLLEELCGLRVPEGQILDPAMTLAGLARAIEQAVSEHAAGRPTFASVHGASARTIKASDLRLDRFLSPDELAAMKRLTYQCPPAGHHSCLLTGASGFLGRFLVLSLLERLPDNGGRLYCLVRAADDVAADRRLRAVFERAEPELRERFERLSANRLIVLAGDLMKPRLGLSEKTFEHLAGELDLIVHNGALVNHAFSYAQLFEPNVLGTVEVIRLASHCRLKAVSYVSTVGVLAGARPGERVSEAVSPGNLWHERPIDSGYAVGYATSKWAGEVLLEDLQRRTGAPVAIFRPTMILTPERYAGEINAPDLFVRLLAGLVYTGIAPGSFYDQASGARPSFDGLPADFIAQTIAAISFTMAPGLHLYNVANPQGNAGISLDTVVDWIVTAGYPIRRIADHARWYQEFGDRLRALDASQRQHSPLPILFSWEKPERPERQTRPDNSAFRGQVQALLGEHPMPHLSEALVHKTLAGMAARGLIPEPGRPGAVIWAPAEPVRRGPSA